MVLPPTPGRAPEMTRETRSKKNKWSQTRKSAPSRVAKQRVRVSARSSSSVTCEQRTLLVTPGGNVAAMMERLY
ncbi:hypothetical protein NDU88_005178 [Pleurodeles waltl]|uniref:Uncharacterized protein n=1 Tax=Pleurodeles waltl TaxID=8319 RepID=A0AAV7QHJ9_PLEWA|nr:hypothetical protein NDU88_005178 [Pleurodeles waltl]